MKRSMSVFLVLVVLAGSIWICNAANISRQESTGQLKKVVYSGNCADCPQTTVNLGNYISYLAHVAIPEIKLTNMPSVSVFVYHENPLPPGWVQLGYAPEGVMGLPTWKLSDKTCVLYWKYYGTEYKTGTQFFAKFKIVVTYESAPLVNLAVQNPGTGKSLDLNWQPEPQAERINGYKVLRRERVDQK
jgi:hypothetical protein